MADNGSSMYISGDPDNRWSNDDLGMLKTVPASAFEVLLISPLYTPQNLPQGQAPAITNFTANPSTIQAGQSSTLSWTANGASYSIVFPQIGAIRGTAVAVTPAQTTTYTPYSTNAFGRSKATVTVTVQ